MGEFRKLIGTTLTKFQLGIGGPFLKAVSSKVRARNAADNADAELVGSILAASGDDLVINEDAAGSGADWKMTFRRPGSGMSEHRTVVLPSGNPAVGQVLQVASYAGGVVTLDYLTVAAGSDKTVCDTTSLAHNTSSPLTLFTLPANAVITLIQIIIDTAFDGAPTVTIGVTGTTSKYAGATDSDLTAQAGTVFEIVPGQTANGATENLIATYSAASATVGAARILIYYVIPS